jgi:hypothetical protein
MRFVVVILASIGLFLILPQLSLGQQESAGVKKITFQVAEDGLETVQFLLNGAHIPKIFMLDGAKPRLVLDFPDATYSGKTSVVTEKGALVRGIRVGFHRTPKLKTRVVIDLAPDRKVAWDQDFVVHDNLLAISIRKQDDSGKNSTPIVLPPPKSKNKPALAKQYADKVDTPPAEPEISATPSAPESTVVSEVVAKNEDETVATDALSVLLDITFDNVYAKSGEMVLFKLNDFHPPTVSAVEKGTPRIVCDFPNTRLADAVPQNIDADGTFVDKIKVVSGDSTDQLKVVLELLPGNDYDLQQVFFKEDNLFVLIINNLEPEQINTKIQ